MTAPRDRSAVRIRCLFALALATTLAVPQGAYADRPGRKRPAFTQMEAGPYGRAHYVLLAKIERVIDIDLQAGARRGPQLVHVKALQIFKGPRLERGRTDVTIRIAGPKPTLNPERPSKPYLQTGAQGRYVFFLARRRGGHAYDLQTLFEAESDAGQQKVAALTKIAALQQEPDEEVRARATLKWLVGAQRASSRWARINAARELNYLADQRADLFDATTRNALRSVPAVQMPRDQRVWLQRLFARLGDRTLAPPTEVKTRSSAWRRAYQRTLKIEERAPLLERALTRAKSDRSPQAYADLVWAWDEARRDEERIALADRFADGEHKRLRLPLRTRYAAAESIEVREAIVRFLGRVGDDADVPWLTARLGNLALRRAALLALARIRTSSALEALRAELQACAAGDADARQRATWITHLLSDLFVETERKAGRSVGPR